MTSLEMDRVVGFAFGCKLLSDDRPEQPEASFLFDSVLDIRTEFFGCAIVSVVSRKRQKTSGLRMACRESDAVEFGPSRIKRQQQLATMSLSPAHRVTGTLTAQSIGFFFFSAKAAASPAIENLRAERAALHGRDGFQTGLLFLYRTVIGGSSKRALSILRMVVRVLVPSEKKVNLSIACWGE